MGEENTYGREFWNGVVCKHRQNGPTYAASSVQPNRLPPMHRQPMDVDPLTPQQTAEKLLQMSPSTTLQEERGRGSNEPVDPNQLRPLTRAEEVMSGLASQSSLDALRVYEWLEKIDKGVDDLRQKVLGVATEHDKSLQDIDAKLAEVQREQVMISEKLDKLQQDWTSTGGWYSGWTSRTSEESEDLHFARLMKNA